MPIRARALLITAGLLVCVTLRAADPPAPRDALDVRRLAGHLARAKELHADALLGADTSMAGEALRGRAVLLTRLERQLADGQEAVPLRALRAARTAIEGVRGAVEEDLGPLQQRADRLAELRAEVLAMRGQVALAVAGDSALAALYAREIAMLQALGDSTIRLCDARLNALLRVVDTGLDLTIRAVTVRDRIAQRIVAEEVSLTERRHRALWQAADPPYAPLVQVIERSWRSAAMTINVVWSTLPQGLVPWRFLLLALFSAPIFLVRTARYRSKQGALRGSLFEKYPIVIGAFVLALVLPFTIVRPPQLFHELAMLVTVPLLAIVVAGEHPAIDRRLLWSGVGLVLVLKCSNLLIEPTGARRFLLALSIGLVPLLIRLRDRLLTAGHPHPVRLKTFFLVILLLFVVGWCAQVLGWYRLGSNLIGSALDGLVLALGLAFLVRLSFEGVQVYAGHWTGSDGRPLVDPGRARVRLVRLLNIAGVFIWAYAVLNGMDLWDVFWIGLSGFLNAERTLFGATFTWMSVVVFYGCFAVAIALSELVKDLFLEDDMGRLRDHGRGGLVLILRLVLLATGGLVALWSSGIPLDRLVVLMGAFGLGIGLGFQQLANNLVSGVMLALERPVRPGDEVIVQGRNGIVRDIGVRSTRVLTYAGSTLMVPNSMLVSDLVENRTINDRSGRLSLFLSVPLDNDLQAVQRALAGALTGSVREGLPEPRAHLVEMDRYWAVFEVHLWVANITQPYPERDAALNAMAAALRELGVSWKVSNEVRRIAEETDPPGEAPR